MKSKIFFLILVWIIQQGVLNAQEKQIEVSIKKWTPQTRSFPIIPILLHNGNTVYIYSDLPLDNLEVSITDILGNTVYTGFLIVEAGETISFTFDDTGNGEYMIEIAHGVKYLYGRFKTVD